LTEAVRIVTRVTREMQTSGRGWRIMAAEIAPGQVDLLVKAHLCGSASRLVGQFKGLTSRRLRAQLPALRSCLLALWSRLCVAATAGAVSAQTVRRYTGTRHVWPWRKERAQ
jgi:putative transposase